MTRSDDNRRNVDSLVRAFNILEEIRLLEGARISELAEKTGYAKSTIHAHLTTLREHNYVVKEGDIYDIGLLIHRMGEYAGTRQTIYREAEEVVQNLSAETGERAQFLVEENTQGYFLHRSVGDEAVKIDSEFERIIPLHASAAGKAVLAYLPEDRRLNIINSGQLVSLTENTTTDPAKLQTELETVREEGIAISFEETVKRLNAVGVPVLDINDRVLGALSVSGPAHRLKGDRLRNDIPELLLGKSNELELNTTYI